MRVTFHVGVTHELVTWVLGFGGQVVVISPPNLVRRVREAHEQALARLA